MTSNATSRSSRSSVVTCALLATAAALLAGCGGSDSTSPNPPPPPPPPPADVWSTVAQRTWSIPSNTETYKCHSELVTSDKYFTGFRLASPSAAQTELYVLMRPSAPTEVGDYDCGLGDIDGGEAIYIAGPGTTQLEFNGGKGVHVPTGQYLMFVVHIVNTTSSSVTSSTKVEGRVVAAKDVTTPIDMFLVGRLDLDIEADGAPHIENGSCVFAAETHLVAAIPLMRARGTHVALTVTDSNVNQALVDSSFDPQHLIYTSFTSDLDEPTDVRINTSCTFVNNTGVVVNYGESASDEICFEGTYRYPPKPPTSVSPLDCAMGHEI
jgi:hypothetical protein